MTTVVFYRSGGVFYGFEEQGHTGYGEEGGDILCSALSAMTMFLINTVEVAYASQIDYEIDDGAATVRVQCRSALPEFERDDMKRYAVSGIFMGYYQQLADMLEEYGDYLDVKVVNRPYGREQVPSEPAIGAGKEQIKGEDTEC